MTSYTAIFVQQAMKESIAKLEKSVEAAAEDISMDTEMEPAVRRYMAALEELCNGYRALVELQPQF